MKMTPTCKLDRVWNGAASIRARSWLDVAIVGVGVDLERERLVTADTNVHCSALTIDESEGKDCVPRFGI